ncbi:MAG: hypothetical protein RIE77_02715 [Phycisphaerales bacterium]|jgi:hypothetical protein
MARPKVQIDGVFGCKLAFCVVALVAIAGSLLTIRQMRTQAAHEFASLRLRVMQVDEYSKRLRADISRHVGPDELHARLAELDAAESEGEAPGLAMEDRDGR